MRFLLLLVPALVMAQPSEVGIDINRQTKGVLEAARIDPAIARVADVITGTQNLSTANRVAYIVSTGVLGKATGIWTDGTRMCMGCTLSPGDSLFQIADPTLSKQSIISTGTDSSATIQLYTGPGTGAHAYIGFGKNGDSTPAWLWAGVWNGEKAMQMIDVDDNFRPRMYVPQDGPTQFFVYPEKPLWIKNPETGDLQEVLQLGKATDVDAPMVSIFTSDVDGEYSDLLDMRINRDSGDFRVSRTDALDSPFFFFRTYNINTGDAFLDLRGDTGKGAWFRAFRNRGDDNYWSWGVDADNGWHLVNGPYDSGISHISINNATGYFGIGRYNVNPAATLHVMDDTPSTGTTELRVQAGQGQGSSALQTFFTSGGAVMSGFDAIGSFLYQYPAGSGNRSLTLGPRLVFSKDQGVTWSGTTNALDTQDVGIFRHAEGTLKFGDAASGDYFIFDGPNKRIQFGGVGSTTPAIEGGSDGLVNVINGDYTNYTGFRSSGVDLLNTTASQMVRLAFLEGVDGKWSLGKSTDDSFFMYDYVNSKNFLTVATNGDIEVQPTSGTINLAANASSGAVASGNVSFADAATTRPFKVGTTLPATCTVGMVFFKSDATAGQNIYLCTGVNTWTQVQGTGAAGFYAAAFSSQDPLVVTDSDRGTWGACPARVDIWLDDGTNYVWTDEASAITCNKTTYEVSVDFTGSTSGIVYMTRGGVGGGSSFDEAGNYTMTGSMDFNGGSLIVKYGSSVPGTCTVGNVFIKTGTGDGLAFYVCTATNTYVLAGDGTSATDLTDYINKTVNNTYSAGAKQIFQASGGSAGFKLACATLPSLPSAGDCACDSGDGNKFKCYNGATWVGFGSGGSSSPGGANGTMQYNNSGSLGGVSSLTTDGTNLTMDATGSVNLAAATLVIPFGSTLPTTCVQGTLFARTGATAGFKLYYCETTNTWEQQGVAVGSGLQTVDQVWKLASLDAGSCKVGSGVSTFASSSATCVAKGSGVDTRPALQFPNSGKSCIVLEDRIPVPWNGTSQPTGSVTFAQDGAGSGNVQFTMAIWHITEGTNIVTPSWSEVDCTATAATGDLNKVTAVCPVMSITNAGAGRDYMIRVCRDKGNAADTLSQAVVAWQAAVRWTTQAACAAP